MGAPLQPRALQQRRGLGQGTGHCWLLLLLGAGLGEKGVRGELLLQGQCIHSHGLEKERGGSGISSWRQKKKKKIESGLVCVGKMATKGLERKEGALEVFLHLVEVE